MKRGIGIVLVGLGAFLLVLAGLLRFYVVPQLAKAPLVPGESTGGISTTTNDGIAEKLFDPGALATGGDPNRTNVKLLATRTTRGDVLAAEGNTTECPATPNDLAIYDSFQNLTDESGTTIDASTIRVSFNRVSSELNSDCGANVDGETVDMTGVNPLKFPMFTQAQTYNYFDSTLNKAIPIEYTGTQDLDGVTCYIFKQSIPATQFSEQEVPGSLVGSPDAAYKAARFYQNERELIVEPNTGSIIGGTEQQKQWLTGPDGTEKVTIIQATISTTQETKQAALDDAKTSVSLLNTLKNTVPIVGGILGIILLVLGFWLVSRKDDTSPSV